MITHRFCDDAIDPSALPGFLPVYVGFRRQHDDSKFYKHGADSQLMDQFNTDNFSFVQISNNIVASVRLF